jgi:hypothetical protein
MLPQRALIRSGLYSRGLKNLTLSVENTSLTKPRHGCHCTLTIPNRPLVSMCGGGFGFRGLHALPQIRTPKQNETWTGAWLPQTVPPSIPASTLHRLVLRIGRSDRKSIPTLGGLANMDHLTAHARWEARSYPSPGGRRRPFQNVFDVCLSIRTTQHRQCSTTPERLRYAMLGTCGMTSRRTELWARPALVQKHLGNPNTSGLCLSSTRGTPTHLAAAAGLKGVF